MEGAISAVGIHLHCFLGRQGYYEKMNIAAVVGAHVAEHVLLCRRTARVRRNLGCIPAFIKRDSGVQCRRWSL